MRQPLVLFLPVVESNILLSDLAQLLIPRIVVRENRPEERVYVLVGDTGDTVRYVFVGGVKLRVVEDSQREFHELLRVGELQEVSCSDNA